MLTSLALHCWLYWTDSCISKQNAVAWRCFMFSKEPVRPPVEVAPCTDVVTRLAGPSVVNHMMSASYDGQVGDNWLRIKEEIKLLNCFSFIKILILTPVYIKSNFSFNFNRIQNFWWFGFFSIVQRNRSALQVSCLHCVGTALICS